MSTTSDHKPNGLRDGAFGRLLELELRRSRRYQYFTSLLMIEANSRLLDRYGNNHADVLQRIVTLLRRELRETDLVGLQNENVVTILLPYSDKNSTRNVASRLTAWLAAFMGGSDVEAQVRVGGASFPSHASDLEGLCQQAGEMLQRASFHADEAIQILE